MVSRQKKKNPKNLKASFKLEGFRITALCTAKSSTWKVEAGSGGQSQPLAANEFKARLGYLNLVWGWGRNACLKNKEEVMLWG